MTGMLATSIKYWERRLYNREAEKIEMKSAILASMLALIMLFMGGGIFTASEPWSYIDSFYFCFITLTTIGFGDLVPGLSKNSLNMTSSLFAELGCLIYYVIGLSVMSGVILSISNLIEEKTKKFDVQDPMEAIRNLRIENLNSKAMKKLGYKVTNGPLDENTHYNLNARRGTIVPDDIGPRGVSKLLEDAQKGGKSSNTIGIPTMLPNGTITRRAKPKDAEDNTDLNPKPETATAENSPRSNDDETDVVDGDATEKATDAQLGVCNSVVSITVLPSSMLQLITVDIRYLDCPLSRTFAISNDFPFPLVLL